MSHCLGEKQSIQAEVVDSVLRGSDYERSTEGILSLGECISCF